ncbi:immunoglobulin-like domain-containing protein, partial [Vibrio splendidus]
MSLTADASVTEGGTITYTATLTSAAASDVTVTLSNNETITIYAKGTELADGSIADGLSGSVEVTASDDVYVGGDSASVTITDATGGNFEDLVKDSTPANTTITDD